VQLEIGTIVFFTLVVIAALGVAAKWLRIPYPIVFTIGGALLALIPNLPLIELDPNIVFLLFLPPLLYGGGFNTEWRDFKRHSVAIFGLAIGLVLATTIVVAYVTHALFAIPLAVAFVLGAIVSPPDAVATEAIADEVSLPRPIAAILSGESLINDASALVIYAFALAAVATSSFSLVGGLGQFVYVSVVGVAIGAIAFWLLAKLLVRLRGKGLADDTISVLFSLSTPYLVYLLAEAAHASGVLAAVTAGILTGRSLSVVFDAESRIAAAGVWSLVTFAFNGVLFVLIGLQLRYTLSALHEYPASTLFIGSAAVAATVILVRFAWVFTYTILRRKFQPGANDDPDDRPDWRWRFIISWAGMRGIVTLAASLALPEHFPQRDLVVFLAFVVIVVTLVGQGLTLPLFIRRWNVVDDEDADAAMARARVAASQAGLDALVKAEIGFVTPTHWDVAGRLRSFYESRLSHDQVHAADEDANPDDALDHKIYRELRLAAYTAEREALRRLRIAGELSDEIYRRLEWDIDLAESRLTR
jgi:CPA1 family monovalent cation:H+ antiporter